MTETAPGATFLEAPAERAHVRLGRAPGLLRRRALSSAGPERRAARRTGRGAGPRAERDARATGTTPRPPRRPSSTARGSAPVTSRASDEAGTSHRRPGEGHVHLRRGERLPGRGGGRALRASGRGRGRRDRGARPDWGEVGAAYVVAQPDLPVDADELRAFLRTRLARYKVPVTFTWSMTCPAPHQERSASRRCARCRRTPEPGRSHQLRRLTSRQLPWPSAFTNRRGS